MSLYPTEFCQIRPGLFHWQAYDPTIKADLSSSAIATPAGFWVVDPIPLESDQLEALRQGRSVAGIIVTNSNHKRAAFEFSDRFSVPIYGRAESLAGITAVPVSEVAGGAKIGGELEVIEIEGAAAGEIALYYPANGGTLILGDALINFEPHGFALLPRRYCLNEKQMRRSFRKLLDKKMERMLFAHGAPIVSGASERLARLLNSK